MKHLLLLSCLLGAVLAHAQAVEVPEQIASMYNELCIAIASGDNEGARGHVSQLAALQATFMAQGDREHILRLAEVYKIDSLAPTFTACIVKDQSALVSYDLKLVGTDKASGDRAERTWHCQDQLTQSGTVWLIAEHNRVDPDALKAQLKDGLFRNEKRGVELAVPEGWVASVPVGGPGAVLTLYSPDLVSSATVLAVDLPVKVTAKAVVEAESKILAAVGINQQLLLQEDATLAGAPSYRVVAKIATPEQTVYSDSNFRVDSAANGDILYALVFGCDRDEPMNLIKTEADAISASLKLTGPQAEELPAELGKLADGKYINATQSISMDIAEGWVPRISKSRFLFQLTVTPAEGQSSFMLGAVDIGQYIDPKLAAQGDLQTLKLAAPDVKILGEGARDQEGIAGYQTLMTFTLPGEETRTRWQCFFMRQTVLYFIVGDAVPSEDYDNVKDAWGEMVNSLTWLVDTEG